MTISKDDVLAALGKIAGPEGVPLPATGKLSDIVVADGKVFFSITVDAGAVEAWEAIRERAKSCRCADRRAVGHGGAHRGAHRWRRTGPRRAPAPGRAIRRPGGAIAG